MASESLNESVRFWARRWPTRPAVYVDDQGISWGDLDRSSDEIAAGLHARGVGRGDAVGILMRNRLEFVETMVGIMKAGAAVVLLNIRYTAREMVHPIADSQLKLIVTEAKFLDMLAEVEVEGPPIPVFTVDAPADEPSLEDLRARGAAAPDIQVRGDDTALICYTSGTTGQPKGAMLTHGGIYAVTVSKAMAMGLTFEDRLLMPLPLAYTGGTVTLFRDGLILGCTTFLSREYGAEDYLDLIERERITSISSVPVVLENMMNLPRFASTDLSSLKHAASGGAGASLHLLATWQQRGVRMVQSYGLTESSGSQCTLLFSEDAERKVGFSGRRLSQIQVRTVREDGTFCEPFEPGEIWVAGPTVMKGYLNNPEKTAEALAGGWLHTGDVGLFDEEGFLKVVDRSKDMLISGGLNVYPAELEKVLSTVPGLVDFAVIGVPDPKWGEVPLLVTADAAGLDIAALRRVCEHNLADYKRPKFVVGFGAPLPRTISGKIHKPSLRERYAEAPADAVPLKRSVA